ncbi:Nudix hydrolase 14, chloroplastic [Dionaea muscipula]
MAHQHLRSPLTITPLAKTTSSYSSLFLFRRRRSICSKMSADSPPLAHTIILPSQPGEPVPLVAGPGVTESDFRSAMECSLFKQWLKNMEGKKGILADESFSLKQVLFQGVDYFGKRVGFLKFKAEIIDKETGNEVPGIVFARGPAVAILILLESEGETYAVLTEQVRVPTGRLVLELPAGMLDDDKGDFVGTAVREVEEETGIQLNIGGMIELTAFLDSSTGSRVFPSPGGCDEEISIFLYRESISKEIIQQLQGKQTGLREHGELIKVHVIPYSNLWRATADAKVLMAIALYEMAKKEGLDNKSSAEIRRQ